MSKWWVTNERKSSRGTSTREYVLSEITRLSPEQFKPRNQVCKPSICDKKIDASERLKAAISNWWRSCVVNNLQAHVTKTLLFVSLYNNYRTISEITWTTTYVHVATNCKLDVCVGQKNVAATSKAERSSFTAFVAALFNKYFGRNQISKNWRTMRPAHPARWLYRLWQLQANKDEVLSPEWIWRSYSYCSIELSP